MMSPRCLSPPALEASASFPILTVRRSLHWKRLIYYSNFIFNIHRAETAVPDRGLRG